VRVGIGGHEAVESGSRVPLCFDQREGLMTDTQQPATEAQQTLFRITDFVGQWPPTFLLFGLYHRLVRPSRR
jgi:hypothetical protein